MTEHPIIFNAQMVRAILAGNKTQTRRIVKHVNSIIDGHRNSGMPWNGFDFDDAWVDPGSSPAGNPGPYLHVPRPDDGSTHRLYPLWQPGDRLCVLENWQASSKYDQSTSSEIPAGESINYMSTNGVTWDSLKRNALFMPLWASRITLEITGMRVQRVQDISEEDALSEGVLQDVDESNTVFVKGRFCSLWNAIYGLGSWDANPWSWVIEFRRIKP
jgi:hypothetical protein